MKFRYKKFILKLLLKVLKIIITKYTKWKRILKKEKGKTCDKTHDFKVCEEMLDELGYDIPNMPINPIDEILNAFGKDKVAELTGRTLTFSKKSNGIFLVFKNFSNAI